MLATEKPTIGRLEKIINLIIQTQSINLISEEELGFILKNISGISIEFINILNNLLSIIAEVRINDHGRQLSPQRIRISFKKAWEASLGRERAKLSILMTTKKKARAQFINLYRDCWKYNLITVVLKKQKTNKEKPEIVIESEVSTQLIPQIQETLFEY